jgi:hypothetical protein
LKKLATAEGTLESAAYVPDITTSLVEVQEWEEVEY